MIREKTESIMISKENKIEIVEKILVQHFDKSTFRHLGCV